MNYRHSECQHYPNAEVEQLENYFNKVLGVHARHYGYWLMFQSDEIDNCWLRSAVRSERWIQQHSFGPIKALLTKGLKIDRPSSSIAKQRIDEVFQRVNEISEDHDEMYLCKTTYFTAVDLTFVAPAYPVIFPPECDEPSII